MRITLNTQEADALRAGRKTTHRMPITPQPAVAVVEDLFGVELAGEGERYAWPSPDSAQITVEELARACPHGRPGQWLELFEQKNHGKVDLVRQLQVVRVRVERLEQITDAGILAEGYPNWTQYAAAWNQHHARSGAPW